MQHAPLAFVSGSFTNSELRWATLDREALAIVETFRRLEWLLWSGPVFTDHRNLIYIFNPQTAVSKLSKAASQRLLNWATFLGKNQYSIRHIEGEENLWGDLLSRWISTPPVSTPSLTVLAPLPELPILEGDIGRNFISLPSVDIIRGVQLQFATTQGEDAHGFPASYILNNGTLVTRTGDGMYAISSTGALWIPEAAKYLQLHLMVCAHCGEAGHRGRAATF